jgi:hypothetical protein
MTRWRVAGSGGEEMEKLFPPLQTLPSAAFHHRPGERQKELTGRADSDVAVSNHGGRLIANVVIAYNSMLLS